MEGILTTSSKYTDRIITLEELSLSNNFQSGEFVHFISQDPKGDWIIENTIGTGEATWYDDEQIDDMKVPIKDKKGIHGCFRVDAATDIRSLC